MLIWVITTLGIYRKRPFLGEGGLPEGIVLSGRYSIPGISDPIEDIPGRFGAPVQHTSLYGEKNIPLAKSPCN